MVFCLDHAVADASSVLLQVACCDSQVKGRADGVLDARD